MPVEIIAAVVLLCLFAVLVLVVLQSRAERTVERRPADDFDTVADGTDCPLCGETMPRGKRVHSVLFPGKDVDLMRIFGCSQCWEGHAEFSGIAMDKHDRICPVCRKVLPAGGYVMARVFRKQGRKPHVQVFGCTICAAGRG